MTRTVPDMRALPFVRPTNTAGEREQCYENQRAHDNIYIDCCFHAYSTAFAPIVLPTLGLLGACLNLSTGTVGYTIPLV